MTRFSEPTPRNRLPQDSSVWRHTALAWGILVLVCAVVYGRVVDHQFLFNWDDNVYVTDNPAIAAFSFENLREVFSRSYVGNYAPVQMLSYMLDNFLWGLSPAGFLTTNLVLHLGNGFLLFRLLARRYDDSLIPLVAAAVFLLHPVQVETVSWVSQRKNLLAMLFFLVAWELYCRYREASPGKRTLLYSASIGSYLLALLAKSVVVILPVLLILDDHCFPTGERRSPFRDKIPFFLAAGVVGVIALQTQLPDTGGGRGGFHGGSPLATFFTMLTVFCRYLGMLVWPAELSGRYNPLIHRSVDAAVAVAALILLAVVLAGFFLYRRDRRTGFWAACFFVGLLPVSQIVPLVTLMNDRYLYFPMVGAAALAGIAAASLRDLLGSRLRLLQVPLLAAPLLALALVAGKRVDVWKDALSFWTDAVAKASDDAAARASLAEALQYAGKLDESRRSYEAALALDPDNTTALNGLGTLLTRQGEVDRGEQLLRRLVRLNPTHVKGWVNLGHNYLRRKDLDAAEKMYRHGLALQPGSWQILGYLGNIAVIRGDLPMAFDWYRKSEVQSPGNPETAYQLACIAALRGNADLAMQWLEQALCRGYDDAGSMLRGDDLAALRQDPRFLSLLQRYGVDGACGGGGQ